VYQAAVRELDSTENLSDPITFDQGQRLTYIQACIKEGLRLHPAVGMLLERLVPNGGATFDGVFFPAGTIVGINPWVVALDKNVYGKDANEFRPERWLEASAEEHKLMERSFLAVSTLNILHVICCWTSFLNTYYSSAPVLGRVWARIFPYSKLPNLCLRYCEIGRWNFRIPHQR
jgi:hypothetical protein